MNRKGTKSNKRIRKRRNTRGQGTEEILAII